MQGTSTICLLLKKQKLKLSYRFNPCIMPIEAHQTIIGKLIVMSAFRGDGQEAENGFNI